MAHPIQLSATEQDTLVKQIGLALLRAAPRDWQRITAHYRTVGRYHELDGEITLNDGTATEWVATHDIATLFGKLRAGMYREERGTWFNARYQLDAPASYNLEYDREEPQWNLAPPPQAYADELRMFPRTEDNVPEWLMRRMAGLGPERPGPRFRIARIFDGTGPTGRPVINRPELDVDEQDRLLTYLGGAPVVLPGRGYDIDRLAASPEARVPVAFHSDGTWIWPAAVNYYLHEYGVCPEPELLEHIRNNDFAVPEVGEDKRIAAKEYLTRNNSAPARPQQTATVPAAPVAEPEPAGRHSADGDDLMQHTQTWTPAFDEDDEPATPPAAESAHREAQADVGTAYYRIDDIDNDEDNGADGRTDDDESRDDAGAAPEPNRVPALERMRATLTELGVPSTAYSIGEPAKNGWSIEEVTDGWRVGWYDDALTSPALFGDVDDAAAFLAGKLLLSPGGPTTGKHEQPATAEPDRAAALGGEAERHDMHDTWHTEPPREQVPPPPPRQPPPPLPPRPAAQAPPPHQPQASRPAASGAAAQQGAGPQQWPIQPLPGEPPLTLFRGKSVVELPPGSELDRFGGPEGNLTYAAGTPFEERSLVPEWVNRPYHVYRLQRPIEALTGIAIPWFGQSGGGSAYVLPAAVEDLVVDGVLIELDPGEPPID